MQECIVIDKKGKPKELVYGDIETGKIEYYQLMKGEKLVPATREQIEQLFPSEDTPEMPEQVDWLALALEYEYRLSLLELGGVASE